MDHNGGFVALCKGVQTKYGHELIRMNKRWIAQGMIDRPVLAETMMLCTEGYTIECL